MCAAVFTRNAFCAAPVILSRQHLQSNARVPGHAPRFWLVNSGNANAGTGSAGMASALATCQAVALQAGCAVQQVLPFSTGVIGQPLPADKIIAAIPELLAKLDENAWPAAARAIMTTDTRPKSTFRQAVINGVPCTLVGIAKGAGMIRPDMATLLVYLATDAAVAQPVLQVALQTAVDKSFNRITVDGDTSTNDACALAATGKNGMAAITTTDQPGYAEFVTMLTEVCVELAQAVVRDGEGATKFVTVAVEQGRDAKECLDVAYAIAHSPLVKTALFASDANWGRILAAVGRAGVQDLDLHRVQIWLDDVCIVRDGGRALEYTEAQGAAVMAQAEITIRVDLGARGTAREQVWTCDFSYDYVKINAEYRT